MDASLFYKLLKHTSEQAKGLSYAQSAPLLVQGREGVGVYGTQPPRISTEEVISTPQPNSRNTCGNTTY